jgi:hypothetical protein
MVVWGTDGRKVSLGRLEERPCQTCGKNQPFELTLAYRFFHVYWFFRWVTNREYWLACQVCQHGWTVETQETETALGASPIPRWDRYGLGALGAFLAVGIAVLAASAVPDVQRDRSGIIAQGGTLPVFQFRVGDCYNDVGGSEITHVPGVPCSEPHDNEVFALVNMTNATLPGSEELQRMAFELCLEKFDTFVGRDYASSALDVAWLVPTATSWRQRSDREIVCAVYRVDHRKLVGSMKGSGL